MKPILILLAAWNVITFLMMGIDKLKAKGNKRRISEKTLLLSGLMMGAPGILSGMMFFHHKTRKWVFKIIVPISLVLNILVVYVLFYLNIK